MRNTLAPKISPLLPGSLLDQASRLDAALDWLADGVVGADGLVGGVPEPERLLRDRDVEAAIEIAHGLASGVAQVVTADRLHDDLDRIRGMFSDQIREGVPTAGAAPALARLMAGGAQTLLDHGFGAALGAAGDGWVDWRYARHGEQ
jgi:hypothetical protein